MQAGDRRGEKFFLVMGLILIAFVLAGFVPMALTRSGGIASMPLLLHIHGAVFVAWYVLYSMQASLVGKGNVGLHMKLGRASIVVAVTMVILGYLVVRGAYAKPEFSIAGLTPAASVMFPFTDIANFVIVYALALANRRVAAAHKRLMLLTCILMIDPAVARLVITLGAPAPVIVLLELGLFAALFGYDFVTRRRPHWASVLGLVLYVAALAAKLGIAPGSAWAAFVDAVFG